MQDERSVDAFHDNGDYLYQVYVRQYYDGKVESGYGTQGLLAEELKNGIPEIAHASGLEHAAAPGAGSMLQAGDKIIKLSGFYAGADFFTMFSQQAIGQLEKLYKDLNPNIPLPISSATWSMPGYIKVNNW